FEEDLPVFNSQEGVLSLSEVHEHLIRSPPPTSLPKTLAKNVFVFPVPKTLEEDPPPPPQVEGTLPSRSQSLKPLVTRQHEDVLDHHLRQILHTQRQLVVTRGRSGETVSVSSSSVPGSPAHTRGLARRSPHARTLSEEATVVQSVGTSSVAGGTVGVSGLSSGVSTTTTSLSGSLAPVLPPGRRQHSSSDLLLNPANPPTGNATSTPPMLKPISSKTKRSTGGPEAGLASTPLCLPIRYPHQPATSSPLIDIT
ncbi:uncharacterized protein, partial [Panulirus ornatus]|uniref:uncharacterized protein n=1 Tax=Panulirus ornatus TaxID=150431 RepID=UPI003A84545C